MSLTGLFKLANVIFRKTQTALHFASSNMVKSHITNKRNFPELVLQPEEPMVTSSRHNLFFIILFIKRDWVWKKTKVNFS